MEAKKVAIDGVEVRDSFQEMSKPEMIDNVKKHV